MNRPSTFALSRGAALKAAAFATLLTLAGCESSSAAQAPAAPPAAQVTVAEVVHKPLRDWAEFSGRLEAVQSVEIRPRVSGTIDKVAFEEGARVKKGQLLFRIDPRPFLADVARASASRARAVSQLELAKSNHARAKRLLDQNAIAKEEFDQLSTADISAASDLAAATAALDTAQLNLDFTMVRAPIDGRVSRAMITLGNLVSNDSLLTTVVSDDPVYAYFDADEQTYLKYGRDTTASGKYGRDAATGRSSHKAAAGAQNDGNTAGSGDGSSSPVYLGLADEQDYPHSGRLDFVDNQVNPATGTIRARGVFANPDGAFTPGLFARIKLVSGAAKDTVLIDDRAVGTDLGRKFVLVLKGDNTVDYRAVTLGQQVDGLRVVNSGLKPGDVIVVNGLQRVRPGAAVAPTKIAMEGQGDGLRQVAVESAPASSPPVVVAGSAIAGGLHRP